jgi:metal-responsive CopG/Arc/MetJ family transcriptional regulator
MKMPHIHIILDPNDDRDIIEAIQKLPKGERSRWVRNALRSYIARGDVDQSQIRDIVYQAVKEALSGCTLRVVGDQEAVEKVFQTSIGEMFL